MGFLPLPSLEMSINKTQCSQEAGGRRLKGLFIKGELTWAYRTHGLGRRWGRRWNQNVIQPYALKAGWVSFLTHSLRKRWGPPPKKVLGSSQFLGLPEKNASQPHHLANTGRVARLLANMGPLAYNAGFETVCFCPSLKFQEKTKKRCLEIAWTKGMNQSCGFHLLGMAWVKDSFHSSLYRMFYIQGPCHNLIHAGSGILGIVVHRS